MLFAQLNGVTGPVGSQPEEELLENIACAIGPRVDGIAAGRALPQAMGAFVTSGSQGMCAGRGQQSEQHTPTIGRPSGFGAPVSAMDYRSLSCTGGQVWDDQLAKCVTPPSGMTQGTNRVLQALQAGAGHQFQVYQQGSYQASPPTAPAPQPVNPYTTQYPTMAPTTSTPTTFPAGTITAYSASRGAWRVAIPTGAPGLGIFTLGAPFTEVAPMTTPPTGATQVTEGDFNEKIGQLPFYKSWKFWAIVAGTVIVIGGGVMLFRRRKPEALHT